MYYSKTVWCVRIYDTHKQETKLYREFERPDTARNFAASQNAKLGNYDTIIVYSVERFYPAGK